MISTQGSTDHMNRMIYHQTRSVGLVTVVWRESSLVSGNLLEEPSCCARAVMS